LRRSGAHLNRSATGRLPDVVGTIRTGAIGPGHPYGQPAAAAWRRGGIDGVFQVAKVDAPVVRELSSAPEVHAASWQCAEALQRRWLGIVRITVPAGVLDLQAAMPGSDIVTMAARATLAAREDVHPAFAHLPVRAAKEIHGEPPLLNAAHVVPKLTGASEIDVPEDMARLHGSWPPLLYRCLPC
jgi:hypothetical protein